MKEKIMPPFIFWAILGGGLGIITLIDTLRGDTKESDISSPAPPPTKPVKDDELRRVMSYLGKRSGESRGKKAL